MSEIPSNLNKLPKVHGRKGFYRLRWRFDFTTGKVIRGSWNQSDPKEKAWAINKTHLLRAFIEGEMLGRWIVEPLLEIAGQDYASMRWVATASMAGWSRGEVTVPGRIAGLTVITRDDAHTVFIDGSYSNRKLSDYEKAFKLREHGG